MARSSVWALVSAKSYWVDSDGRRHELADASDALPAITRIEDVLRTVCDIVTYADASSWLVRISSADALDSIHSLFRGGIAHVARTDRGGTIVPLLRSAYLVTEHRPVDTEMARMRAAIQLVAEDSGPPVSAGDDFQSRGMSAERDRTIEDALRTALKDGGFYLEVQPVVNLATGHIAYSEGLLRIAGTPFGPEDFIPVAERTGLIHAVGEYALSLASSIVCDAGEEDLVANLSINISPLQLRTTNLSRVLNTICTSVGGGGSQGYQNKRLELEVTESMALSDHDFRAIRAFEQEGYVVAVDDFGAGHSSIRQLLSLAPSKIKIDREILALLTYNKQLSQLKNLTSLAKARGSQVVVEGIETTEHLMAAREAGAEFGQGFFLYRPMSPKAYLELLSSARCPAYAQKAA